MLSTTPGHSPEISLPSNVMPLQFHTRPMSFPANVNFSPMLFQSNVIPIQFLSRLMSSPCNVFTLQRHFPPMPLPSIATTLQCHSHPLPFPSFATTLHCHYRPMPLPSKSIPLQCHYPPMPFPSPLPPASLSRWTCASCIDSHKSLLLSPRGEISRDSGSADKKNSE